MGDPALLQRAEVLLLHTGNPLLMPSQHGLNLLVGFLLPLFRLHLYVIQLEQNVRALGLELPVRMIEERHLLLKVVKELKALVVLCT